MMQRSILEEIKFQLNNGKMTVRLIIVNVIVFVAIYLVGLIEGLFGSSNIGLSLFTFPTSILEFAVKPWTLFTSIIAHFSLGHLFFNMLFLFFAGSMFEQVFGGKKLLLSYIFGGIMGNLFELTVTFLFPDFSPPHYVVGASGAIMAVFTAIAVYRPQTPIYLFGIIAIPIYVLALFFLAKDLIGLGASDEIAHFAHLGGAFFGFLAVQNIHSQSNILNRITRLFERKQRTTPRKNTRYKTDEVFNSEKKAKQERIDEILDKISKSGYESLSREEKDYLFNQGQK
jgi:membrane associated rhomboid family serine protease